MAGRPIISGGSQARHWHDGQYGPDRAWPGRAGRHHLYPLDTPSSHGSYPLLPVMAAAADLPRRSRKRHLPASPTPRHFHGPQRHRRFRPFAFRLPFLAPPPEARSAAFDMGNFLSGLLGWRPRDNGLGVYREWVDASGDARDLTVVTRDDVGIGHVVVSRRVGDPRKASLEAAAPRREKKKPYYKEALEWTRRNDPRLDEIGVELRLTEEKLHELRKSAEAPKEDLSELFIPLTAEEENEVHDCLYGSGSSSKVLVLHESSNIEVSREKFRCLRPGGWLNDEVINLYLELLKEREVREPKSLLVEEMAMTTNLLKDGLPAGSWVISSLSVIKSLSLCIKIYIGV